MTHLLLLFALAMPQATVPPDHIPACAATGCVTTGPDTIPDCAKDACVSSMPTFGNLTISHDQAQRLADELNRAYAAATTQAERDRLDALATQVEAQLTEMNRHPRYKHCKTHHITHGVRSRTCSVKKVGK